MGYSQPPLWGDIRSVVLSTDSSAAYIYVAAEPGQKDNYAISLYAGLAEGMGLLTVFISDEPEEVVIDEEKLERIEKLDLPPNLYIYSARLDKSLLAPLRNWLRQAVDTGMYTVRFVVVEPRTEIPLHVEEARIPLEGERKASFMRLLDALDREYWMLDTDLAQTTVHLSRVSP
jgi:hypothetical protein